VSQLIQSGNIENVLASLSKALLSDKEQLREILLNSDIEKNNIITIARGVPTDAIIELRAQELDGVFISDDFVREYVNGPVFAHVVGYDGTVRTGLEYFYNDFLEGEYGSFAVFYDARGNQIDSQYIRSPKSGYQLTTTIDADLQEYFYYRLLSGLKALGRTKGVGIAMNPQTGEILSLISLPSFDNTIFASSGFNEEKARLLNSPSQPLFNRAISGLYNPGSTIKPLVAFSALQEEVVMPDTEIFSRGYIEIPNPYYPDEPSRFVDWKPHGWVDVRSALARSSNIYFYAAGGGLPGNELALLRGQDDVKGLGINVLNNYWRKFLLDRESGVDLPGEKAGFLPNPEEKEIRTGSIWRVGDTYNVSIGQGDLLVTPLQLLTAINALANGGMLRTPFLAKHITNENGKAIKRFVPTIRADFSQRKKEIEEVQKGMEDAVQKWYGTAYMLSGLPYPAAGKTGSAQTDNNTKTNAFFVGYAPDDDPAISVLVLVEDAKEGSLNAVPVAYDVLEWYYWNRIADVDAAEEENTL